MLEYAVIRKNTSAGGISIPRLLDVMLFYGNVHLVLDGSGFPQLLADLGVRDLNRLLGHPNVTSEITTESAAVQCVIEGGRRTYGNMFYSLASRDSGPNLSRADIFKEYVRNMPHLKHQPSREAIQGLLMKGKKADYKSIFGGEFTQVGDLFCSLASDEQTLRIMIDQIVGEGYSIIDSDRMASARFHVHQIGSNAITVDSSIPIEELVNSREANEDIWGAIFARLHDYAIDLFLSQNRSADLIVSPEVDEMATKRLDLSLKRGGKSSELISQFEEFTMDRGGALGAAYLAGIVTFEQALGIIDDAQKFRKWLSDVPPSADLIREYHEAATRKTVLETFGGRAARFALINGGGILAGVTSPVAGVAVSLGLGMFDTFVLDRIAGGWRPNAFIDGLKRKLS